MYRSPYPPEFLEHTAEMIIAAQTRSHGGSGDGYADAPAAWCIFDNTTLGAATGNALELGRIMEGRGRWPSITDL